MKTGRRVLVLALALLIASPLLAAEKKKAAKKAAPKCPAASVVERMTKGMTISDDQKVKFDAIKKEFGPKLMDLMKKRGALLTPEQSKKYMDARKAGEAAGKKGKELQEAAEAAMGLDADTKAKLAEINKESGLANKDLSKAIMEVLTPEQKDLIKKAKKPAAK